MKKAGISETGTEDCIGIGKGILPDLRSLEEFNTYDTEIEKDFSGDDDCSDED